jgi:S1-C subfamily serine protease
MLRKLFLAGLAASTAAVTVSLAQSVPLPKLPAKKPDVKQGIVPNKPSDPISDFGLGVKGFVLPGQGYVISKVTGGPARRVGLEAGDIIKLIDGKAITTEAAWTLALKDKDRVTLKVLDARDPTAPLATKSVNLK